MATILAAILGKKVDEKLHRHAKILCAKFGYERANGLGGVGEHTYTDTTQSMSPLSSIGPSTSSDLCGICGMWNLCGNKD